jgi:hypothetical protein
LRDTYLPDFLYNTKSPLLNPLSLETQKKTTQSPSPFRTVNIHYHLHIVFMFLNRFNMQARACLTYDQILNRSRLLTNSLMIRVFLQPRLESAFYKCTVWFVSTTFRQIRRCLTRFMSLHVVQDTDVDCGLLHLPDSEIRLTTGVTGRPGYLYSSLAHDPRFCSTTISRIGIFFRNFCINYCSLSKFFFGDHCSLWSPYISKWDEFFESSHKNPYLIVVRNDYSNYQLFIPIK